MISKNDLFAQFGGGREGWWEAQVWERVLLVLSHHEGESISSELNSSLYDELEAQLDEIGRRSLSPRNDRDPSRSVFRAASSAWTATGVAAFDRGTISVTADGKAVLAGKRTREQCLHYLFSTYTERQNGKNPFLPVLELLMKAATATFEEVFDCIQDVCTPEMLEWRQIASIRSFPYTVQPSSGNPVRSVNLVLKLLADGGLISEEGASWRLVDSATAQTILDEAIGNAHSEKPVTPESLLTDFAAAVESSGLQWGSDHAYLTGTLIVSLLTKRFVILTGLSGSGKTRLAIALGQWLGVDQYKVVPVRPDWTSPDATMGYQDGLLGAAEGEARWHVPEVLEFVLRARSEPSLPFILILDEMNLAQVERYFAEMLSGIESGERVVPNLVQTGSDWKPAATPSRVAWPQNVFVIGTVNADETTYAFSPKVLDRANTIEFRVKSDALQLGVGPLVPVAPLSAAGARSFQKLSESQSSLIGSEEIQARLRELHGILAEHSFEFGHRVFQEAVRFRWFAREGGLCATDAEVLDLQMMQKILPRIHGAQRRVQKLLDMLHDFATAGGVGALPRTTKRIDRMRELLNANHFVSFTD